jgi:hypothetical protein
MFSEAIEAPIFVHAGMEKILVDGGQLKLQLMVQQRDNVRIDFHICLLRLSLV